MGERKVRRERGTAEKKYWDGRLFLGVKGWKPNGDFSFNKSGPYNGVTLWHLFKGWNLVW